MTNDRLEQADVEALVERLHAMSKQHLQSEMESPEDGDYEGAYDWFVAESRAVYAGLSATITARAAEIARLEDILTAGVPHMVHSAACAKVVNRVRSECDCHISDARAALESKGGGR